MKASYYLILLEQREALFSVIKSKRLGTQLNSRTMSGFKHVFYETFICLEFNCLSFYIINKLVIRYDIAENVKF